MRQERLHHAQGPGRIHVDGVQDTCRIHATESLVCRPLGRVINEDVHRPPAHRVHHSGQVIRPDIVDHHLNPRQPVQTRQTVLRWRTGGLPHHGQHKPSRCRKLPGEHRTETPAGAGDHREPLPLPALRPAPMSRLLI